MPRKRRKSPSNVRVALPVRGKRRSRRRIQMRRSAVVATALLVFILFLTLSPQPASEGNDHGGCFWCGHFALADAILNLLLFLPIGFLLALRHRGSPVRTWASLTALAVAIELAQLFLPGRFATLSDVLMNSSGAAIGIGLARLWKRGPTLRIAESGRLTILAGAAAACVTLGSTLLLQASLPESMWFGQWTPDLGHYEQYDGEVLEARIGEVPIPSRRLDDSPAVRTRLQHGDPLVISFVAGPLPLGVAPVFSIYDGMEREILVLGVRDQDLVFRLRRRASDWRFRSPEALYPGAGTTEGDTALVRLVVRDRSTCLEIPDGDCIPLATPGRGWSLLLGAAPAQNAEHVADFLWLGLLFVPVGYSLRRRRTAAVGLAISLVGLLGASLLGGAMTGTDWLVTGLGPVLGVIGGVWTGRTLAPDFSEVQWLAR
jgi:VanZ family protein